MNIPKIFKPEQFFYNYEQKDMAPHAQSIFDTWLKANSKVVYGFYQDGVFFCHEPVKVEKDTHQALLVLIEPIKQEPTYCSECGKQNDY